MNSICTENFLGYKLEDARAGMLVHQLWASCVSVCSEFVEMNQIINNSMRYTLYNLHISDNYSKYFIYNNSSLILFHCDFTYNLFKGVGYCYKVMKDEFFCHVYL